MNRGSKVFAAWAASVAGLLASAPVSAQSLDDKFWLEATAYRPSIDSSVQVSSTATGSPIGTQIDLENDLDLANDKTLPALEAGVRIGKHFQLVGEYYKLGRSASIGLARDIVFDNVTYPASVQVTSEFDSTIYRATFGYSFLQRPNAELGVALGLHGTDFVLGITGEGTVGNSSAQTEVRRKKVFAPLPTIGLYGTIEIVPRLNLAARIDYLSLKIDDYDGRLINTQAKLSYRVWKRVQLGVMYRYVDYRLGVTKPEWTGQIKYKFSGPAAFLHIGF